MEQVSFHVVDLGGAGWHRVGHRGNLNQYSRAPKRSMKVWSNGAVPAFEARSGTAPQMPV